MKRRPDQAFLFSHPAHFIALGFGTGLMPKAPGTWGTLVAYPIFFVVRPFGIGASLTAAMVCFLIGIWAAEITGKNLGIADYGGVVIDEIAAFLLVLAFAPPSFTWWLIAFLFFRLFDIVKPWPIRWADRSIKGGFGVMFDDVLAAIYSIAAILLLRSLTLPYL